MFKYLLLKTYFNVSEKCLVEKTKTYNVTIKDNTHIDQMDYMKTDEFKELYAEWSKIEVKNAEVKNNYGYSKDNACRKLGITIQGETTLFYVWDIMILCQVV